MRELVPRDSYYYVFATITLLYFVTVITTYRLFVSDYTGYY